MLRLLVAIGCVVLGRGVLGQFTEPPPTTADPDTIKDCTWWHVAASGDTCESVSARYRITTAQLTSYASIRPSPEPPSPTSPTFEPIYGEATY